MIFKKLTAILSVAALAALARAGAITVIAHSPASEDSQASDQTHQEGGRLSGFSGTVSVSFDRPMVSLSSMGEMGKKCPIEVSPKVSGRCRWYGTQTLVFEPESPLPSGGVYTAVLKGGLKSVNGEDVLEKDYSWTFTTGRPKLVSSRPEDNDKWITLNPVIFLNFNMKVSASSARGDITLVETDPSGARPDEEIPVGVRQAAVKDLDAAWGKDWHYDSSLSTSTVLVVKPSRELRSEFRYSVRLGKSFAAFRGGAAMREDASFAFSTYKEFKMVSSPLSACLPSHFPIELSNPVRSADLLAALSSPDITLPVWDRGWRAENTGIQTLAGTITHDIPSSGFLPGKTYRFTIKGSLKDVFGNALGKDVAFSVTNTGYCPSFVMGQDFGILESYLPARHPVKAVNLGDVRLEKQRIPEDAFIPFYTSLQEGKKAVLSSSTVKTWDLKTGPSSALGTFIDMGEGLAAGKGGIVFAQVFVSSSTSGESEYWFKTVDNITDTGVTFKTSPVSSLVWATALKTGVPVPNARVEIRSDANKVLWTGRTDSSGVALAPGWKALGITKWKAWQRPRIWAFVRSDVGPAVMSSEWRGGVDPWRFNINVDYSPRPDNVLGTVFTDRGIYRSGEKVYIKGIFRNADQSGLSVFGRKAVHLDITDSRGNVVLSTNTSVSRDWSSMSYAYQLEEGAPSGEWQAHVSEVKAAGKQSDTGEADSGPAWWVSFRVEAFRQAGFEVKAAPSKTEYYAGDDYSASVGGWYMSGGAMNGAKYDWKLRIEPTVFAPPGMEEFDFSPVYDTDYPYQGRLLAAGKGRLDKKGKGEAEAMLEISDGRPVTALLDVSVMSPDRQKLFNRQSAIVHPAELYIGIRTRSGSATSKSQTGFAEKGETVSLDFRAVTPKGKPVSGAPVDVVIKRTDYLSVMRAGVAGRLEWVNEKRTVVASTFSFVSGADAVTTTFVPSETGDYVITASSHDGKNRKTATMSYLHVAGKGEAWWKKEDNDIVQLLPEKTVYKPGETAKIMVKSPYDSCTALVTVEREGVLDKWVTRLNGGADSIEVPLKDSYAPNVYVGVALVKGRVADTAYDADGVDLAKPQVKFGYTALDIDTGGRKLDVRVTADAAEYRPRGEVRVAVKTLDDKGNGVSSEVTVFAVDEGVLSLTDYVTPDLFGSFYGGRPLSVFSSDSRLYVIGQRNFGEKGRNRGGGGGDGVLLEGADLRSRFVPVAYWNPSVVTDASGRAEVSFRLPDNLSKFRIMAVASSLTMFGRAESRITVSKPVMLKPSSPVFARVGDTFDAGAIIHNYACSDPNAEVSVELQGSGLEASSGMEAKKLVVEKGRALEAFWSFKAVRTGTAKLVFHARSGAETDALEVTVPVRPVNRRETVATASSIDSRAEESVSFLSGHADDVQISLSRTALAGLKGGMDYLAEYPYGCLEQKISAALPILSGEKVLAEFGVDDIPAARRNVQAVIDRLGEYRHSSGGFGYWPNPSDPDPYVTAYALEAVSVAKSRGYNIRPGVTDEAVKWLEAYVSSARNWAYPYSLSEEFETRAYGVYVLSRYGVNIAPYFDKLYEVRGKLPLNGRAYLLFAAKTLANAAARQKTLEEEIIGAARLSQTSMSFDDQASENSPWTHGSAIKTTALCVDALMSSGNTGLLARSARWLVDNRKGGRWNSTMDNAFALRALEHYYTAYEGGASEFSASVADASGTVMTADFKTAGPATYSKTLDWTSLSSSEKFVFSKTGRGRLYYTLRLNYTPAEYSSPASEGFIVSRTVRPLEGGSRLRAGDRAVVTLKVRTRQNRTFVALEDFVPAGFEIINGALATESSDAARLASQYGMDSGFGRFEKYDDRIAVFADFLPAGEHTYSYMVQAVTPGRYSAPPAWASQMYEPEVFGRTASSYVEVER